MAYAYHNDPRIMQGTQVKRQTSLVPVSSILRLKADTQANGVMQLGN